MKRILPFLLLLFLSAVGCSNSDSTVDPGTNPTGGTQIWRGVTAKLDSEAWSADNFDAIDNNGYTAISATAANSEIALSFPTPTAPTTLQFRASGATGIVSNGIGMYSTDGNSNAGTLTITEVSATHIAGSFSFTAADMHSAQLLKVTSGKFNVVYR